MFRFGPRDKVIDFKYFPPLLAMAESEGCDLAALLEGSHIREDMLALDDYKASAAQVDVLLKNIACLCRPGIALDYGARLNLSAFGVVGFAALSSPTARDAIYIAHRYMPVVLPLLAIDINENGGLTHVDVELTYQLDTEAERVLLEATLSSLYTMASFILQDKLPLLQLEIRRGIEPYYEAFLQNLKVEYRGHCEHNRIIVPTSVLDVPLPLANQGAFLTSVKQCDELLEELPTLDRSLSAGIQKRLLYQDEARLLTQEDVAQELFMSVRTMHRLLQREGTSFREIANETTAIKAKRLLEDNQLSVSQIALELGYSDSANFTRAFRNQAGLTPSEYRRRLNLA